jgi:hypothetical protein
MQATTVREALRASLAGTFGTILSVLPRLIVFAIALAVGWAISSLLARGTVAVLGAVRFDVMARRSGLAGFIEKMGVRQDASGVVASVGKWLVRVMTLVVALDVLGLPAGSGVLHQMLLWLPNLAVALVALVLGGLAATALSRLVQGSAAVAGLPNPRVLATATSVAVWAFAVVMAVSQLGIATSVANLALVGVVGGLALAGGLAFGWAGRDRAAQLLALLDDRYASRAASAGSVAEREGEAASPAATIDSSPPSASEAPPSPVAVPSIPVPAPVADASASASSPAPELSTSALSPDTVQPAALPDPADLEPAPALDVSEPMLEVSPPEFEAVTAEFEPFEPELESSAPEGEGPALALALFPEDESAPEPPRAVPFEESWIPRSGVDRRRIARPGPDRRASVA